MRFVLALTLLCLGCASNPQGLAGAVSGFGQGLQQFNTPPPQSGWCAVNGNGQQVQCFRTREDCFGSAQMIFGFAGCYPR